MISATKKNRCNFIPMQDEVAAVLYFLSKGVKLHFYSLGTICEENMRVSRGAQLLWLWVSNRGEQHSAGTRFCAAKSSVLYLLRPLTLERGCHRTGQTFSCGSRRTNSCKHGRLADIRSSGVGDAAKCRSLTETVLHRRGSKRYIKPAAATHPQKSSLIHPSFHR